MFKIFSTYICWIYKMQRLEVSGAVRPIYGSLGVKRLIYLSISTCFGRLRAHHQEKQMCLCDTWYLLFCVDDCLGMHPAYPDSCFSWRWAHSRPKYVEIDKYTKNKLCTKSVAYPGILFGGGGSTNSVEDRGQREWGCGGGNPQSGVLEAAVIWYKKFHFI